jgi:hypothetical protein
MSTTENNPDAEEWVDPYPKKKRYWMGWITVPFLLLTLYVLSTGPMSWLDAKGKVSTASLITFYFPLIELRDAYPPVEKILDWYVGFWLPATVNYQPRNELPPQEIQDHF